MNKLKLRMGFLIENFLGDLIMSHRCSRVIYMNETSTPMTNDELLEMAANNRRRAAVNLAQWVDRQDGQSPPLNYEQVSCEQQ